MIIIIQSFQDYQLGTQVDRLSRTKPKPEDILFEPYSLTDDAVGWASLQFASLFRDSD